MDYKFEFGICITACLIIDERNGVKELKVTELVKIVCKPEEKYCLKLLNDNDNIIYLCEPINILIVNNYLMQFLLGADYWGRLDILRFKKKILTFDRGSRGNLQLICNKSRYFVQFIVLNVGQIQKLGNGYFLEIMASDLQSNQLLWHQLWNHWTYKNEQSSSIIVRVEQLISEIELPDFVYEPPKIQLDSDKKHTTISPVSDKAPENLAKNKSETTLKEQNKNSKSIMDVDILISNIRTSSNNAGTDKGHKPIRRNDTAKYSGSSKIHIGQDNKSELMEADYIYSSNDTHSEVQRTRNKQVLRDLDNEKLRKVCKCWFCGGVHFEFGVPCDHFICDVCNWRLSWGLGKIVKNCTPASCPICLTFSKEDQFKDSQLKSKEPINKNGNEIADGHQ